MFEELQFIDAIVKEFIIYIILALAAIVGGIIRRKYNSNSNKFDNFAESTNKQLGAMKTCLDTQNERGIRQSKSQIDIAEHLDNETERLHPNTKVNKIKNRVERNLKDKAGNL